MSKADKSLAAKADKSGISLRTLRKVYKRGVAAWNSGHRPGTTPQQWGHARVNSYINKGKTYHTADKDLREDLDGIINPDINTLFEMQLVGTDEYRRHAIAMTPGQDQEIEDAFPVKDPNQSPVAVAAKPGKSIVSQYTEKEDCGCEGDCGCDKMSESTGNRSNQPVQLSFRSFKKQLDEYALSQADAEAQAEEDEEEDEGENDGVNDGVDFMPTLKKHKPDNKRTMPSSMSIRPTLDGLPITTQFATYEEVEQINEAVQYHIDNNLSFTENVFRPGSDMFFAMINEARKLYAEGKYTPADEYEVDLLNSNIGEKVMFEGKEVILDFPFEELINEADDPTDGKGVGKPFRQGSGAAVYVRNGKGNIIKVKFSQSGMKKRYNEPARVRSFVARHKCLTNKDKTSASYWACRWPRYFSNTGQQWW